MQFSVVTPAGVRKLFWSERKAKKFAEYNGGVEVKDFYAMPEDFVGLTCADSLVQKREAEIVARRMMECRVGRKLGWASLDWETFNAWHTERRYGSVHRNWFELVSRFTSSPNAAATFCPAWAAAVGLTHPYDKGDVSEAAKIKTKLRLFHEAGLSVWLLPLWRSYNKPNCT